MMASQPSGPREAPYAHRISPDERGNPFQSPQYKPGNVVNGHRLSADGTRWEPLAAQGTRGTSHTNRAIIVAGAIGLLLFGGLVAASAGSPTAVAEQTATIAESETDYDVEWAYMSGVWNGTPVETRNMVCEDFRSLGPQAMYEQNYLDYSPQPVHADGRVLSYEVHTDFYNAKCM